MAAVGCEWRRVADELGFVPLSKTGAEMLLDVLRQRHERGATLVTSNLPLAAWTEVQDSERLTAHRPESGSALQFPLLA